MANIFKRKQGVEIKNNTFRDSKKTKTNTYLSVNKSASLSIFSKVWILFFKMLLYFDIVGLKKGFYDYAMQSST